MDNVATLTIAPDKTVFGPLMSAAYEGMGSSGGTREKKKSRKPRRQLPQQRLQLKSISRRRRGVGTQSPVSATKKINSSRNSPDR